MRTDSRLLALGLRVRRPQSERSKTHPDDGAPLIVTPRL